MSKLALLALAMYFLGLFSGGAVALQLTQSVEQVLPPLPSPTPKPEYSIIQLINKARLEQGLAELHENALLDESAKDKACDMRDREYFEHEAPTGEMAWHYMTEAGYTYEYAGETLVQDTISPDVDIVSLLASTPHREAILSPLYTEVGTATCGRYAVQHFGDPL